MAAPITVWIHFVHREPGLTVTALLDVLGVTKQSLNRVLRTLIDDGLIESRIGRRDRRERQLFRTEKGSALERRLSETQRARDAPPIAPPARRR